ncbi:MAG: PAS domain-containing sensor histidine kinase [Chloroflexi bacterium]|nr:PAS domain-containing sensor histidine kinase [Chloroflexota bacterium]
MTTSSQVNDLLKECSKDEVSYQRLLHAFEEQPSLPAIEQRYHIFDMFLPEALIWADINGVIVHITRKCYELLGYNAETLNGQKWEIFCHPDEVSTLYQITEQLSVTDETLKIQHRLLHHNGSYIWVESTCRATKNALTGEIEGFLSITRDITQQRLIEAERDASEEKFFFAFHASPLAQFIGTFDEGRIIEANRAFADLLGTDRTEILGRTSVELGAVVDIPLRNQLYEQLSQTGSLREIEYLFRRPDGGVRTVLLTAEKLEINHQPCFLGMYYDITERRAAAAAQVASEQKFATVFHRNPIPMALSHLVTTELIEANPAFCKLIGLPCDKLVGFSTLELGLVVDPVSREAFYSQAETQGSVHGIEQRFRTNDGQIRTLLASAEIIEIDSQSYLLSMFLDITERKQAEEALATERQLLRVLIDNLPDFIYYKDAQARFLISNVANTQVLGLHSAEEVVGKSDLDFYPTDLAAQYYADDMGVIQSGQPLIDHEEIGRDAEGNNRWVLTNKFPLRNRDGQITGLVGIGMDITERKHAEAALKASEERFYKAFWGSPFGVVITELPSQRIIDANPITLQIGQLSREEIIGRTAEEVGFVLAPATQVEFNRQLNETGRVKNLEASWTRYEKETIVKVAAEIIEISGVPHLLVMFDDITALKQAEQARLEKERLQTALDKERELSDLKTRMMQRISHEFRTPLTVIQTSTGLISRYRDRLTTEQRENLTQRIEAQVTNLTDMLSSISRIVRDEFQEQPFRPEQLDLVALVQESIENIKLRGQHLFRFETTSSHLEIVGDAQHLRSLLINLLANAITYSPPDTPVVLTLTLEDHVVRLRIKDEGIGILPEELGRVTEPFFRGSNFDERPGLGLGMTIAKNIIDLHQGILRIESVPNQGTTVEVCLPVDASLSQPDKRRLTFPNF